MKKLAIIITRGTYNNLMQACEVARVAASNHTKVSVLFRDESAGNLTFEKIKRLKFSNGYQGREAKMKELLETQKRDDFPAILRELKETGDVKLSICKESVEFFELMLEDLLPEIDEVQPIESFWKEEVMAADHVLTF